MTDEELKNKCSERTKIFQQAMESCHSSSPIDCIEWFADRIADLEKENAELKEELKDWKDEWQEQVQKATDEGYARTLQTMQLSKAKEIIKNLLFLHNDKFGSTRLEWRCNVVAEAEQFIKDSEVEK